MDDIKEYRNAILQEMLDYKDEDGFPIIPEEVAKELLDTLTDEELADGMPFNTPRDVAEILLID